MKKIKLLLPFSVFTFSLFLLFQNCGSNSNPGSNASPDSATSNNSSDPITSDLENWGQRKVCTAAPVINVIGHHYGTTDGVLSFTHPVLWTINTDPYGATETVYIPERKSCGKNCVNGQLYGFNFTGIDVHKNGTPVTFGREMLVKRSTDCYKKSFSWLGNKYSDLIFPSVPEFATPNMVPESTGKVYMINDQAHMAMTFRHTNDPTGCSTTSVTAYVDPLVPAVYNLTTKELTIYESSPHTTPNSTERIFDLVEANGVIYATGSNSKNAVYWRDGKLNILPSPENRTIYGSPYVEKSMDALYFALIDSEATHRSIIIWENGSIKSITDVPLNTNLLGFSAESKSTYSLLKSDTDYYYLKNGNDRISLDTSGFTSCIASDIKAFNNKVYVLGYCTVNTTTKRHVIWEDGKQLNTASFHRSSNIEHAYNAKFNVGCQTDSGFLTELD